MKANVPIFFHGGTYISRILSREGPNPVYVCLYKGASKIFQEKKDILKFCQLTKGIPAREAFDKWWEEYATEKPRPDKTKELQKVSWGPEAHKDEEEDPTKNTKMIT